MGFLSEDAKQYLRVLRYHRNQWRAKAQLYTTLGIIIGICSGLAIGVAICKLIN